MARERERWRERRRERWLEKSGGEVCAGPNVSCAYPADLLDAKGLHHSRGVTGLAVGNKFFFDSVTLVRSVDRVYPVSCSDSMSLGMFPRDESWMRNNKIWETFWQEIFLNVWYWKNVRVYANIKLSIVGSIFKINTKSQKLR